MSKLSVLAFASALAFTMAGVAHAGAIVNDTAFTTNTLAANDDGSTSSVNVGFDLNFFGQNYSSLYVNNNGNVTFNSPLSTYTPSGITDTIAPMLAPFFGDVDTRGTGSSPVTYGQGTYDGHAAFGVDWVGVGYYDSHTDKLNSFQLIIVDRSDIAAGDFDFMFNYDQIQWETGDASGGSGGLGGTSAAVGWSNGVNASYQLPGSLVNGAFLDGGPYALISNSRDSNISGQYVFEVRSGQVTSDVPEPATLSLLGLALAGIGYQGRKQRKG